MRLNLFLFSVFLCTPLIAHAANADCGSAHQDVSIETKSASAGTWANLRKHDGCVSVESARMLKEAETGLGAAKPPANFCPQGCKIKSAPDIFFSSVPEKFLDNYSDADVCQANLKATTLQPIKFNGKVFPQMEAFSEWFGDFSQGSGDDGKELYAKCAGSCSPQYASAIHKTGAGFSVDNSVICGPARDKDNNQYTVSIAYRWSCE